MCIRDSSNDEQWNELWENGEHLTSIKYIDSKFALYALHKFFVELELNPATDKIIGKVHFKTGKLLDKRNTLKFPTTFL